ncbi:MAG: hypothetical protein JNM25_11265 [Planctomycetes bacterium]|nr:hypothetical protein [Planctomycetota bacterium]
MLRPLALVTTTLLLHALAGAQCFLEPDATHTDLGGGDDVLLPLQAIGFPFPHAGATYTDVHISTNGFCYLSNGGVPLPGSANGDAGGSYASAASQRTTLLGGAPKILPFYRDLDLRADRDGAVFVRAGTPSPAATPCVITWVNAVDFGDLLPPKTIQCQLYETGRCEFFYSSAANVLGSAPATVGKSPAGGATDPGASDLSAGPTTTGETVYQQFATGTFDLADTSLRFSPLLPGNGLSTVACPVGEHVASGAGCYGDTCYQLFADAPAAWLALEGHSITLAPTATGYVVQFHPGGASAFVPPTGATDFARSDDGEEPLDLTANALPDLSVPGGSVSALWVHMNGIVSTGPGNDDGAWNTPANDWVPTASFRNAPATAFWAWHDWNPNDPAGAPVRWHYDATLGTLYVTWDGVENWSSPPASNPGTFQFQFELASGLVRMLWVTIDQDTTSPYGSGHLVGYSPGGASADPGSLPIGFAGGTTTIDGYRALTLHAAPRPLLTGAGTSNAITYTIDDLPDYQPPALQRLGVLFFSIGPAQAVDLDLVGAPGCQAYIASLDVALPIVASGSATQAVTVTYPAPLSVGLTFYIQAVGLMPPNSFPGGLNTFGIVTSNGIATGW